MENSLTLIGLGGNALDIYEALKQKIHNSRLC